MNNHRVDNAFQKLNTHHSEINAGDVWSKLEPLLEPKKSDRKWLFILLPMLAMLFFVVVVSFVTPNADEKTDLQSTLLKTSQVRTEQNLEYKKDDSKSGSSEHFNSSTIQESSEPIKQLHIKTEINEQKQAQVLDQVSVNEAVNELTQQEYGQSPSRNLIENRREYFLQNEVETPNVMDENSATDINSKTTRDLLDLALLTGQQLSPLNYQSDNRVSAPEVCPGFSEKSPSLQFVIQPYLHYVFNNNSFGPNNEMTNLYQLRDMNESPYYAFDSGLELIAKTKFGVNLVTGINYSRSVDRFEFETQKDTTFLIEDVIKDIFIDANMDSVIVIGDTLVNAIAIESNRLFNNYSTLDFPIGFEYFRPIGRFDIGFSAVALVNITFNVEADAFAQDDEVVDIENFYRDRLSLRYRFALPIQYVISPQVSVGLRPIYTYSPTPITIESYEVEHRTSNFGIGLYTRFEF